MWFLCISPSSLVLLPMYGTLPFMSEFSQELFVYACKLPAAFVWFPVCQDRPLLNLGRWYLKISQVSWTLLSSAVPHGILSGGFLKRTESALLKSRIVFCFLPPSLLAGSWTAAYHGHCSKIASDIHISHEFYLVCENLVWQSISPLLVPWSPASGSCSDCTPEISWIGCAVLYCPSRRCWNSKNLPWALWTLNVRLPPLFEDALSASSSRSVSLTKQHITTSPCCCVC